MLADAAAVVELSDHARTCASGHADASYVLRVESVPDLPTLSARLRRADAALAGVVLEPELAAPDEQSALQLQRPRRQPRVVLYAEASAGRMHAVLRLVAFRRCELAVRGVDALPDWAARAPAPTMLSLHPRDAVEQLERIPACFRLAWVEACLSRETTTVKGVAALASVKRRTVELAHESAGV